MGSSPYRDRSSRGAPAREAPARRDAELVPAFAVLWVASALRVGAALVRHETFAATATLAAVAVFAIPWALFRKRKTLR